MSHFTTHHIFGQQVLKDVPGEAGRLIAANLSPFCWGLQGADLLYLHKNINEYSELPTYGRMIHGDKTNTLFTFLAQDLISHRKCRDYDTLLAYFYGFCCHYALDSSLHPYVFSRQKSMEDSFSGPGGPHSAHWTIEDGIDRELSSVMEASVQTSLVPCDYYEVTANDARTIGGLYSRILWNVYAIRTQAKVVDECFLTNGWKVDCIYNANGTLKPCAGMDMSIINALPSITDAVNKLPATNEDYLNRKKTPWVYHGENLTCDESVAELMAQAKELALTLISLSANAVKQGNRHHITNFDFSKSFVPGKFR